MKPHKLTIPEDMIFWITPELSSRQGEIATNWDTRLVELGWLTEIKEPLSFENWYKSTLKENSWIGNTFKSENVCKLAWNAALENQKTGVVVDEKKDKKAFIDFYTDSSIDGFHSQPNEVIYKITAQAIFNYALKYARGTS